MEVQWFLKVGAKQVGPLSAEQLKAMAQRGQVSEFDPVRRGSDGEWVPASSVKGLLPSRAASAEKSRPRRMPVAKKLEEPPAAGGGFGIDASADTPAQKIAARREGAGTDANRRRLKLAMGVGLVVLVVGVAGVLAGRMLSGGGETTAQEASDRPAVDPDAPEREPGSDVVIAGLAEYLGESEPDRPADDAPAEEWVDASKASADEGEVTVRVTSVRVGRPRLVSRRSGNRARPRNDYLSVALELCNRSQTASLDYASWAPETDGVRLIDNNGDEYPIKSFADRGMEVDGQVEGRRGVVEPERAIADVLLFERPAAGVRFLRLELPRAAFGGEGSLRFEIPISMVVVEARPEQKARPKTPTSVEESIGMAEDYGGPIAIPGVSYDDPEEEPAEMEEPSDENE